jgi:hypothetical protein
MRFGELAALASAAVLTVALATDALAQRRDRDRDEGRRGDDKDWVELGCKKVSLRAERDTVEVGRKEGRFSKIRLRAHRGDVEILDLKVVYGGGDPDDIQVRRVIRRGDITAPLDLRGRERRIETIHLAYRTLPNYKEREAEICIDGLQGQLASAPPSGGGDWVELGCKDVSFFGRDKDTLPVGRREGRFKSIRLHVHGTDVNIRRVTVVYGRGQPDELDTKHFIRAGERSPPMDLKGYERSIQEVQMVYQSIPNFKKLAKVCVEGLQ